MYSVTMPEAGRKLPQLCEMTVRDSETVVVVREDGNVVMVSESDWVSAQETLRVLRDKVALRALLAGHRDRDEGRVPPGKPLEAVFQDLVSPGTAAG